MALLDIVTTPNILLTQQCNDVDSFDDTLKQLISNMFETMIHAQGIGLAAPQIGLLKRLFICSFENEQLVCINPSLTYSGDEIRSEEGCLSIPGTLATVNRFTEVTLSAVDENNSPYTLQLSGMMAIIVQHEFDHLNGKLITDHALAINKG